MELSRRPRPVRMSALPTRHDTLETLRVVQRHAEELKANAERVLAQCASGVVDSRGLAEDLHDIDRSAASIRVALGRLESDSPR